MQVPKKKPEFGEMGERNKNLHIFAFSVKIWDQAIPPAEDLSKFSKKKPEFGEMNKNLQHYLLFP